MASGLHKKACRPEAIGNDPKVIHVMASGLQVIHVMASGLQAFLCRPEAIKWNAAYNKG